MKEHLSFPHEGFTSRKNDGGKFKFEQETMEIFKKYVCLKMAIKMAKSCIKIKKDFFLFKKLIQVLRFVI